MRVGLTGGIGAGKSAVADLMAARGATIVDADEIARQVVVPGAPALAAIVERFGRSVLSPDGTLDRGRLAAIVFSDSEELASLNAVTHPVIGAAMAAQLEQGAGDAGIAVAVIPLLKPAHVEALALRAVVVVDCPVEVAVERLVAARGMSEADARARVGAQPSRAERLALCDFVVDNSGPLDALESEVDRLWELLGSGTPG